MPPGTFRGRLDTYGYIEYGARSTEYVEEHGDEVVDMDSSIRLVYGPLAAPTRPSVLPQSSPPPPLELASVSIPLSTFREKREQSFRFIGPDPGLAGFRGLSHEWPETRGSSLPVLDQMSQDESRQALLLSCVLAVPAQFLSNSLQYRLYSNEQVMMASASLRESRDHQLFSISRCRAISNLGKSLHTQKQEAEPLHVKRQSNATI
ncbi:hypothetical protein J3F83DRAFT_675144 [Trichoderma novae-zelandiae]